MALLGSAALAMWWDVAAEQRADFEHWHSHEHFPERLSIPGFRRASRWGSAEGGDGFFVMYDLESHDVLSSRAYLAHLNSPTPWSTRLMPHHRNMVRSQCRVLASRGGPVARHALTLRLSPAPERTAALREAMTDLVARLPSQAGLTGVHLLEHETPPIAATTEQMLRGHADRAADWVLVVCGYDEAALRGLGDEHGELGDAALAAHGAAPQPFRGLYTLAHTAMPPDLA
jgi:hypothetical protein